MRISDWSSDVCSSDLLGLALVNAALLYFQDGAEMRRALTEQALVTAVTIAEFVRVSDDPARRLTRADQAGAMRAALGPIVGLDDLYLVEPGQAPYPLKAGSRRWNPAALRVPAQPRSFVTGSGRPGDRWGVALAPGGAGTGRAHVSTPVH